MSDEHPFGDAVPGEAVKPRESTHLAGYHPRRKWIRSGLTGRPYTELTRREHVETELPAMAVQNNNTEPPTGVVGGALKVHIVGETGGSAPMTVYDCIVGVSREIAQSGISKTRSNVQQGYKFRGIDDVLNALSPLLAKYRLVILPRILSRTVVEHASKSGGVLFYVTVEAEFDFVSAADGSTHTVKTYGEAMDSGDKATNKAMSAAYKYAAFQTFCIPTEGDNDADATTHEPVIHIQRTPSVGQVAKAGPPVLPSVPNGGDSGTSDNGPDLGADIPEGARRIVRVGLGKASAAGEITFDNGESFLTWKAAVVALAKDWMAAGTPCVPELKRSVAGNVRLESLAPFSLVKMAGQKWTPSQLEDQAL